MYQEIEDAAPETGQVAVTNAGRFQGKSTSERQFKAFHEWAKPTDKRAARSTCYALTLEDRAAWNDLTNIFACGLNEVEQMGLASAALSSLSYFHADKLTSSGIFNVWNGEVAL